MTVTTQICVPGRSCVTVLGTAPSCQLQTCCALRALQWCISSGLGKPSPVSHTLDVHACVLLEDKQTFHALTSKAVF